MPAPLTCSNQVVEIRIGRGVADVDPPLLDVLTPILSYEETKFNSQGNGRLRHQKNICRVFESSREWTRVAAGCVPRVQDLLEREGFRVRVRDFRRFDAEQHAVSEDYWHESERSFPGLAGSIAEHTEGLLEVVRGQQRSRAIGTICRLLPRARIFVAAAKVEKTQSIAAQLSNYVGGEVAAVRGCNWRSPCRVVCGTFASFDHNQASDWDVLIFEDAQEALGKQTHENRARYHNHRIYALADPHHRRSHREDLLFEVLAGPAIYRRVKDNARLQPAVQVAMATYSSPNQRWPNQPRERRQQLWAHEARNKAIAEVARGFADGDEETLWTHGLFLNDYDDPAPMPGEGGVVVVTESVEHAEHLSDLLPDWNSFNAKCAAGAVSESDRKTQAKIGCLGVPPSSIITSVSAAHCKLIHGDVMLMACGGSWPQIPTSFAKSCLPLLIVDFVDDSDSSLAHETNQRLKVYRDNGWQITGRPASCQQDSTLAHNSTNAGRRSRRHRPHTSRRSSRRHR